ncbi:MAG: hypothetical protein KF773_02705 [Deltaproteobacteria bacterium]|nr:hypothetical protein [Deltaproteobacteria bacterium]
MRSAFASALVVACLGAACSATSPRPLPPHRPRAAGPSATAQLPRPPDLPASTEPPLVDERYVAPMLVADVVGVVPLVHWMFQPDKTYLALPTLFLPPLVHVAYGEPAKAVGSLAMRGALLAAVYAAGTSIKEECSDAFICLPFSQMMLANAAIVTVIVVDAFLLARRRRPERAWSNLRLLPSVTPAGDATLGVSGRF